MAVPEGNEAGTAFEGSQSLGVLLQPLCFVVVLVNVEMRSAFKALCTLRTLKGSLFCMDVLVEGEVGSPFEALVTILLCHC